MSANWYYVQGNDRIGPVDESDIESLILDETLNVDSYVWKKGFENWMKVRNVDELHQYLKPAEPLPIESQHLKSIDWTNLSPEEQIFTIKTGMDRNTQEVEYGPYSLSMLKRMYNECRINGKTLIFGAGMDNWTFLADLPVFEELFNELPPVIEDKDRRVSVRRPFVARMYFHDNTEVYEGICRDISVGGLQILLSGFPCELGDEISMNVHPDNSEYSFVASGVIVRLLEGEQGFSLRFKNLTLEAENAISSYIKQTT